MASESNDENDNTRGAGEDEKATRLIASALESPKVVAHAALLRGKEALEQIITENSDSPNYAYVREARRMFRLVLSLDPSNEDVHKQMAHLDKMTDALPPPKAPPPNHDAPIDVLIIGAGASGVGVAITLTKVFGIDPSRVLLVEQGEAVGETFLRWPKHNAIHVAVFKSSRMDRYV